MSAAPSTPPQAFGRYELIYMLAQGGMGEVHLARLTGAAGFEKLFIVKTILPQMATDKQFVDRFQHEAKTLVQLAHSSIAQVYDMGEVGGTFYMAIEYIAGVDLARVQERSRELGTDIPVPIALYLGQRVAEALGYAHRKVGPDGAPLGIVHRDVSPQNAMVSYEGEVKVIDFGLAKSAARSKNTLPATVMGKLGYMSPEQARGDRLDHRSDIYSCGVVFWELLAGRQLFQGQTVGEMIAVMMNPKVPSLRELRPDVSEGLERILLRALAADPGERYSRADDLARALNEQFVKEGSPVSAEEVGNYVRGLCPEEFAAQRKLLSRLSSLARKVGSVTLDGTSIRAPASQAPVPLGVSSTSLRPPTSEAPPRPEPRSASAASHAPVPAAPPPQASGVIAPPAARQLPVVVLALVLVAGGAVAGIFGRDLLSGAPPVSTSPSPAAGGAFAKALTRAQLTADLAPAQSRPDGQPVRPEAPVPSVAPVPPEPSAATANLGVEPPPPAPLAPPNPARPTKKVGKASKTARQETRRAAKEPPPLPAPVAESASPEVSLAPEPPAPTPAPPAKPPAKPAASALVGRAKAKTLLGKLMTVILYNTGDVNWTNCELRLPNNKRYRVDSLPAQSQEFIGGHNFVQDGEENDAELDSINVHCGEGAAKFRMR